MMRFSNTLKLALIMAVFTSPAIAAETYNLDKDHTYAVWSVSHFGYANVTGKFMAEGTISLDEKHPEKSIVNVTIHTDMPNTGVAELDKALMGTDYFDTAKYPTATFTSNKIKITGKNMAKITGKLAIKGIEKDVTLNVKLIKHDMHPYHKKDALGFHADTKVKRSDFNMSGYVPAVSDEVKITIDTEALKASDDAEAAKASD